MNAVRSKLPDRRRSLNIKLPVTLDAGKQVIIVITVGFDRDRRPMEVFCADFKAGTTLHSTVMDACILLSRLYQHGDNPDELAKTLTEGSLISKIAQAVADEARGE